MPTETSQNRLLYEVWLKKSKDPRRYESRSKSNASLYLCHWMISTVLKWTKKYWKSSYQWQQNVFSIHAVAKIIIIDKFSISQNLYLRGKRFKKCNVWKTKRYTIIKTVSQKCLINRESHYNGHPAFINIHLPLFKNSNRNVSWPLSIP